MGIDLHLSTCVGTQSPKYLEMARRHISLSLSYSDEATRGPGWAWHPPTGMLSSGKVSSLCASLNPILGSFDIEKVCSLVEKYYPADFSNQERMQLECQLPHF
jgi:hypothetical protein